MKALRTISKAGRQLRNHFATEHVSLFPFVADLLRYDFPKLKADSRAAANVTLLAVSQAIAFAAIAGLPVVYGVLCTGIAALDTGNKSWDSFVTARVRAKSEIEVTSIVERISDTGSGEV
jgi:hypothetical protein